MFGVVKTVYDNAQNVHHKDIEEASLPIIRFLLEIKDTLSYADVISEIQLYLKTEGSSFSESQIDKIQMSLNRIAIDRSLYHNTSLTTILTKLWSYINKKEELVKRLFEELEEMAGTCSSGFIMRLLNTLSGFEEGLSLKISYEEQIVANFIGRLNAYARKITDLDSPFYKEERLHDVKKLCSSSIEENDGEETDEDIVSNFRDNVLAEMTENTSNWSKRLNFSLFFRTHLSTLREELYDEFKSFVTDSEFDLSIRRAISTYEGVKFMA
jgi:predicted transcriptional regulator